MPSIETNAVHAGGQIDPATGAVVPPIYLSTTFERGPEGDYPLGYVYTRSENPNRRALEQALTALEGGLTAAAFASGSAAMMTLLQALRPQDHVLAPQDLYFGSRQLLTDIFGPWGLAVTFVDMTDLAQVQAAMQPHTRLLLVETPSNPLLHVADLAGLAEIAHDGGAYLVCDNTIATPVGQRPFAYGVDLVVHATTKYLAGHSDVLGGVIIAQAETELWRQIIQIQQIGGAVPSPFECWLARRGLQTLVPRVRTQAETALHLAQFLANHPAVERVLYPGLETHPGHAIAKKQMTGFGGLFSFQVRGDAETALGVAARVKLFTRATSFGGTHSTIEHRASIEAPGSATPQNLLRVSVGLENAADLKADLAQALDRIEEES